MTIDEAIEQEKFKARVDRIKANKRIFHINDEDACNRRAEEHEQIAEWLKELKAYREIGTVEECKNNVLDIERAYNKAIDDFAKKLKYEYGSNEIHETIDEIVEQMKIIRSEK